jgi:putative flippase GtrA
MPAVDVVVPGRLRRTGSHPMARHLWCFMLVGAASTGAYALIFWLARPVAPAAVANAAALVMTAVANTAANRRFTFGVQGRDGMAGDHLGGLIALALALALTNVSVAALQAVHPDPSRASELAALVAANAAATLARFLLLRTLIFDRRRQHGT